MRSVAGGTYKPATASPHLTDSQYIRKLPSRALR